MLTFLSVVLGFLKPIVLFVLSVLWKVALKLTPIVIHELVLLATYVFSQSVAGVSLVAHDSAVQSVASDVKTRVKSVFAGLDVEEKTALVVAPIVLIVLLYFVF